MYDSSSLPVYKTLTELTGIMQNLLILLSDKEKTVIKKRFDIDHTGKMTLEEIGQEFSVTRERIRQVEKNALSKMKRNVFNTSLKDLHEHVSGVVRKHGGLMRKDTLVKHLVTPLPTEHKVDLSSLNLALELHDNLDCVGNTINFYPYLRDRALPDYSLKHAASKIINQLNKYGDVKSIEKLHTDLKPVLVEIHFDVSKVRSLIDIDKRLTLLDDDLVALLEWRHINPRTLRDKILFILRKEGKPMHFQDISVRIEDAKFDGRNVNIQAVHNELIRHTNFVLIGRGIYALQDWGYEKGTVADVIEKLLMKKKEMSQDDIIDQVLKQRQVKRITVVLSLKNNSKFERVGRTRYRLNAKKS